MVFDQLPLPPNERTSFNSLEGSYLNDYKLITKIGAGTFGLIYLVEDIASGKQFAAKMVLKKNIHSQPGKPLDIEQNKKNIQSKLINYFALKSGRVLATEMPLDFIRDNGVDCPLLREIALQLRVHNHPLIATIHNVLNVDKLAIVIIMDYFPQGDLFHNIIDLLIFQNEKKSDLDRQFLMKNVFLQLVQAIEYCRSQNVYHCDLKPENIMIHYNQNYIRRDHSKAGIVDYNEIKVCLIDFGLAMDSALVCCNVRRGLSFYMAPERITNYTTSPLLQSMCDLEKYNEMPDENICSNQDKCASKFFPTVAGDIWLLGVLLVNITCTRNPWPIAQLEGLETYSNHVFYNYVTENTNILREILPISRGFNHLLDKIFVIDPLSRIDLTTLEAEVRKIEFFHDYTIEDKTEKYLTNLPTHHNKKYEEVNPLTTPTNLYSLYDD